ncbi:MAG: hypothetical protein AB1705_15130 [Verrucomicrobiota bacterium]
MILLARILFCAEMLHICWRLTESVDLRSQRIWKLPLSALLFWTVSASFNLVIAPGAYGSLALAIKIVVAIVVLSFLWRENIAALAANKATNALYGDGHAGGGFRTSYRDARARLANEDFKGAIEEVEVQLRKEPADFEGRSMLVEIYGQLGESDRALEQVAFILAQPSITADQKSWAIAAQHQLRLQKIRLEDEARRRR